ncbi:MAG: hypothetical protein WD278_15390 [Pirellulales bacterium]
MPNPKSISDSPWFWLFVFGGMGLVALVTVSPKYARRQERLERMHQTRQRVAASAGQRQVEVSGQKRQVETRGLPAEAAEGHGDALRPLMLFLAASLAVAAVVVLRRRMAREP